ncbi:hypothetical protein Afer_0268 [Acidimicrobium ferrooxidans DSM 10331]|uniref:Uncharacterized protein n=1 Tax=Acidimicrobium ferrooxidans (strain DSM 10331 / JCM 15462 / NBRC 103882 / ICP) TaxID=525909 RepID=C7M2J3_ACIFD|nr:hypothetical protein [Acidimicrobium ferrooxidans]ACU53237.1 hypothetical protein Afer_0268 [Acidimicrobium ferrooxidans DSM 10331]
MSIAVALIGTVTMGLGLGLAWLYRRLIEPSEAQRTLRAYSSRERRSMERRLLRGGGDELPRSYLMALVQDPSGRPIMVAIAVLIAIVIGFGVWLVLSALWGPLRPGVMLWDFVATQVPAWSGVAYRRRRIVRAAQRALGSSPASLRR